jgi:hypothetical protein
MDNKRSIVQPIRPVVVERDERSWHNGGDIELYFYARSLRSAAHTLIDNFNPTPNPITGWDASPVIVLFRNATELSLKAFVGEGSGLLPAPTDPLTLVKPIH